MYLLYIMTLYSDNYAYDFYNWEHDNQCADVVARTVVASAIKTALKRALKPDLKALITYAIENNDYSDYPDSDSHASITTLEFNEIHYMEIDISNTKPNCFPRAKIKYCSIL
jgi:hypothetical protein